MLLVNRQAMLLCVWNQVGRTFMHWQILFITALNLSIFIGHAPALTKSNYRCRARNCCPKLRRARHRPFLHMPTFPAGVVLCKQRVGTAGTQWMTMKERWGEGRSEGHTAMIGCPFD